jgi:hypothetical protein
MKDDRCSVSENSLLSRHFATREEEFFEIGTVSFKCLATLLYQGDEGRLEEVVLVEVGSTTGKHVPFLGDFIFLGTEEYKCDIFLGKGTEEYSHNR